MTLPYICWSHTPKNVFSQSVPGVMLLLKFENTRPPALNYLSESAEEAYTAKDHLAKRERTGKSTCLFLHQSSREHYLRMRSLHDCIDIVKYQSNSTYTSSTNPSSAYSVSIPSISSIPIASVYY